MIVKTLLVYIWSLCTFLEQTHAKGSPTQWQNGKYNSSYESGYVVIIKRFLNNLIALTGYRQRIILYYILKSEILYIYTKVITNACATSAFIHIKLTNHI